MTRNLTAAHIEKLAFADRMAMIVGLYREARDPRLSRERQAMCRVAARYVRGNMDTPAFDLLARLQILEGASGVVSLKPMVAGPWSRNPRQGLAGARDHFSGTNIDPEWFSLGNTGLISKIRGMIRQEFSKWTRGREVHFDPDDILQNGLMGLTKDGEGQLTLGPLCIQFGHSNPGVRRAIAEGKASPADIAGIVGKFFVQKVADQFQTIDRSRAPAEDSLGRNLLDQQQQDLREPSEILADALNDPRSPVRDLVFKALKARLGEGKWAEMGLAFLTALASGESINKGQMAAEFGMAGGTFSKVLREKVYPALEAVRKSRPVQEALEDYAETMQRRFANCPRKD